MKLLILPVLAAALVGCGGTEPSAKTGDHDEQNALEFARCMRDHGVQISDPKPAADGGIRVQFNAGPGQHGPSPEKFQAAQTACRKYMPNGGKPPSKAEQQEMQDAALKYSQCMREHGIDFPDPKFSGDGGAMIGGPGQKMTFNPSSPAFKQAAGACQSLMPGQHRPASDGGPSVSTAGG